MSLQVSVIMIGVKEVDRTKKFYGEGMGFETDQDFPGFVRCSLGGAAWPQTSRRVSGLATTGEV